MAYALFSVEVGMKKATLLLQFVLLMAPATLTLPAQQAKFPDIAGTWVGETDFPATPEKDPVTLVLKKAGDSFTGTITVGKGKASALENVTIEDEDTFSFIFTLTMGQDQSKVKAKLDAIDDKLIGHKLIGSWAMDDGSYGTLELQPQK
jgi:hypothetical protein